MQKGHHFSFADLHQELDVPDVLRICAEHILRFAGIVNILLFLPDQARDWSLAARAGCHAGKEALDNHMMVGDILANRLIPALNQDVAETRVFASSEEMSKHYGIDCSLLEDDEILVVSGESGNEVLIVAIVHQSGLLSKKDDLQDGIKEIMKAVAEQLGRCIRVHFRHLPETDWGSSQDSDFINN